MKKIWVHKAKSFEDAERWDAWLWRSAGVAVTIALWLFSGSNLYACSCAPQSAPEEALQQADVVFRGTAVRVENAAQDVGDLPRGRRVAFRTNVVWKGPHEEEFVIRTGMGGGDCGFEFVVGTEYLVYATQTPEGYYTGLCTRTRDVTWLSDRQNAEEDFQALGPGTPITH